METRGKGVHFSVIMPTLTNTEMVAGVGHAKASRMPSRKTSRGRSSA
ncbi:short-chain dehydrogenase domain protein [Mycobacterium ulcerans str. Harvey]|uniref:Short-chain dehydrogenase domain protein n=1 Tax=Mycobacterium ulcerans str. Harvey TaxID=1299332 RepID=A0ABP3AID5_MYCUL|nr:short-chain dehydrogenase domain protein [Mycobacterium ulcerans str. Harvey]